MCACKVSVCAARKLLESGEFVKFVSLWAEGAQGGTNCFYMKIALAGTGYVGFSMATLWAQ
jgi:hypothetical protein